MSKLAFVLALLLLIGAGTLWVQRLRAGGSSAAHAVSGVARALATPGPSGLERVAKARESREAKVRERCVAVGLPYPPRELFLRALKHEAQLEVWGRETEGPFKLITTHAVLAASGKPGPKRREGDYQVPEGFYEIDLWNPESKFHLSLRVNYPNESDRQLSDPNKPGHDIYIH
ncbi:MAG: transpeptidase, partial [Chthoniobacter sp.]|nr:transpeptidase [Chthoniobacter sp.]